MVLLFVIVSIQQNPNAWRFIFTTAVLEISSMLHNLNHRDEKSQIKNRPQKFPFILYQTDVVIEPVELLSFLFSGKKFTRSEFGVPKQAPRLAQNTMIYHADSGYTEMINNTRIVHFHNPVTPGSPTSDRA